MHSGVDEYFDQKLPWTVPCRGLLCPICYGPDVEKKVSKDEVQNYHTSGECIRTGYCWIFVDNNGNSNGSCKWAIKYGRALNCEVCRGWKTAKQCINSHFLEHGGDQTIDLWNPKKNCGDLKVKIKL